MIVAAFILALVTFIASLIWGDDKDVADAGTMLAAACLIWFLLAKAL